MSRHGVVGKKGLYSILHLTINLAGRPAEILPVECTIASSGPEEGRGGSKLLGGKVEPVGQDNL